MEAFQLLRVTNVFQREQMKLDVEVFDHERSMPDINSA